MGAATVAVSAGADKRDMTPMEEDALVRLALHAANGGIVCAVHVIGPLAHHLNGPVCADRPSWHPRPRTGVSSQRAVDYLVASAAGIPQGQNPTCTCPAAFQPSTLVAVVPRLGEAAVGRPPRNDSRADVDRAIYSGDVDAALPVLDARLDSLLVLSDLARAAHGGTPPDFLARDVRTLAATLTGRERWRQVTGWEQGYDWPPSWRYGATAVAAGSFLANDVVGDSIVRRLVEGRR